MKKEFHGRRNRQGGFAGRSLMALALVFCLLVTIPFISNATDNTPDPKGSLTVIAAGADEFPDLAGAELTVDLYKIADVSLANGYTYTLISPYTGLVIDASMNGDKWRELSQKAAAIALDVNSGKNKEQPYITGETKKAIGNLEPGLYLLVARGTGTDEYVTTTTDGDIVTRVSSGANTYTFLPELVTIPTKAPDANGVINTENSGDWIYDVKVTLKPEQNSDYGAIEIVKTLKGFDPDHGPATFVFQVEAVLNGKSVYSNVVTLVFDKPGEKKLLIDEIPIGAVVTVTEVYSGASYTLTTDETQTVTIETDQDIPAVTFTNEYDERKNGGHSITNHFTHEADGWKWKQLYDKSQG